MPSKIVLASIPTVVGMAAGFCERFIDVPVRAGVRLANCTKSASTFAIESLLLRPA